MNCQELRERMLDHSELDALSHAPEVVSHLESCPGCRERLALERRLAGAFLDLTEKPLPLGLASRIRHIQERAATPDPQPYPFWLKALFGSGLSLGLAGLLLMVIPRTQLAPTGTGPGRVELARAKTEQTAPAGNQGVSPSIFPVVSPAVSPAVVTALAPTAPTTTGPEASKALAQPQSSAESPGAAAGSSDPSTPSAPMLLAHESTPPAPAAEPTSTDTPSAISAPNPAAASSAESAQMMAAASDKASATNPEVWVPNPHLGSSAVMTLARADTRKDGADSSNSGVRPVIGESLLRETEIESSAKKAASEGKKQASAFAERPTAAPEASGSSAKTDEKTKGVSSHSPASPMVIAARPLPVRPAAAPAAPPPLRGSLKAESRNARDGLPASPISDELSAKTNAPTDAAGISAERGKASAQASGADADQIFCMVDEAAPQPSPEATTKSNEESFSPSETETSEPPSPDGRAARIEVILRSQHPDPAAGPIDIDAWVLSKWITVRERIELAPPRNYRWSVSKSGKSWRVVLEAIKEGN